MQCKNVVTLLDALRTDELASGERAAVEKHIGTCPNCAASRTDLDAFANAARALRLLPAVSCREAVMQGVSDAFDRVGDVWVAFAGSRIRMIARSESMDDFRASYAKKYGRVLQQSPLPEALRRQVIGAINGDGVDKPRVDLESANDLEHDVLDMLTHIPRGEVRTYAWVAQQVGRPRAVRAVASVIARNVVPYVVPCHRVVPSSGGIGNYVFGSDTKRALLASEGVDVDQLDALAKKHIRYIGSRTTHIFCFPTCRDAKRIQEKNRTAFRDAEQAIGNGYRPCRHCQPVAA